MQYTPSSGAKSSTCQGDWREGGREGGREEGEGGRREGEGGREGGKELGVSVM